MKVILLRDIAKLGKRGSIADVAEGYAINVLIKKGDALLATPAELTKWKQKEESKIHKKDLATNIFTQLLATLAKEPLHIQASKKDASGQLFAQIRDTDIVDAVFTKTGISVAPQQITISSPIKSVGEHIVTIHQGQTKATVNIIVQ